MVSETWMGWFNLRRLTNIVVDPMEDFSPTLGMEASNQSHPPQLSDWNTFIRLYSSGKRPRFQFNNAHH